MSTQLKTADRSEEVTGNLVAALLAAIKRPLAAYLAWRAEEEAIWRLQSMSDRELRDIGVTRSQIPFAVRGRMPLSRPLGTYF